MAAMMHGTESRYVHKRCRCDECREASAAARRRRRHDPHVRAHGSIGYRNGCRCAVCREGHRVRMAGL